MDSTRPSRDAWAALLAAFLGWVLDAFDFSVFLIVMPHIAKEFGVTITNTAGSVTITLLARLLGSFAAGAAADRFGRKAPLMISVVWLAACDGMVSVAPSFAAVLVLRALFGFGMGAEWTAGATLAMEAWPVRSRGFASGLLQSGWAVGYLLAAVLSAYILPVYGWRAMFIATLAPAFLALPIRIFVKETHVKPSAAVKAPPITRALVGRVVYASFVLAFGFAIYFGFTTLLPTLLRNELSYDAHAVARHVAWFNVGMLIGAPSAGLLAMRIRPTRAIAAVVVLAPLAAPLAVGWAGEGWMLPGAVLIGIFAGGPAGVTPVWLSMLFPAWFRARGNGLCYHFAAGSAAFAPFAVSAIAEAGAGFGRAIIGAVAVLAWAQVAVLLLAGEPSADVTLDAPAAQQGEQAEQQR
jgi:SHS family lactate transporter-like MFS transporter